VDNRKLYVLIGDGEGEADKMAHRLKAAGIRRIIILAGGEKTLQRKGLPGLETRKSKSLK
jgi:methylmalonyl-CoA mutase cobalamin-binding subunit